MCFPRRLIRSFPGFPFPYREAALVGEEAVHGLTDPLGVERLSVVYPRTRGRRTDTHSVLRARAVMRSRLPLCRSAGGTAQIRGRIRGISRTKSSMSDPAKYSSTGLAFSPKKRSWFSSA